MLPRREAQCVGGWMRVLGGAMLPLIRKEPESRGNPPYGLRWILVWISE